MKRNLNKIAHIVAQTILLEEFKIADEESKQSKKSKEIDSEDLRATEKQEKEIVA